jgi:hypothetical protein
MHRSISSNEIIDGAGIESRIPGVAGVPFAAVPIMVIGAGWHDIVQRPR